MNPSNSPSSVFDFSDAPGGDLNLDDIFGENPSTPTTVEQQPSGTATTPEETTPQVTDPEPIIKTKTGTVYKSLEDAVEGIEHKDALIAQFREREKQRTGNDPLTPPRQTQVQTQTQGPKSYIEDQDKYFEDIAKAVSDKDTKAYMSAQQKLIWDSLGPLAPTITALSRANAERVVTQDIPDFKGFLSSDQYIQLDQVSPLLAEAIRTAESNPQAASQLPELYKVAYLSSQGRRVPELLQSVKLPSQVVQPRPTVHSTPVPPPQVTGIPVAQPSLDTREGRAAIIKKMDEAGIGNQRW